jgi:hypothetical protein
MSKAVDGTLIPHWERRLQTAKPYLFKTLDQVVADYPAHRWGLLAGDDISGRLPAMFVWHALRRLDPNLPAVFIAAGRRSRNAKPRKVFDDFARQATEHSSSVLIVSEAAGTFTALTFLRDVFAPHCKDLSFALVSAHREPPKDFGYPCYLGGTGAHEAAAAIYRAFESLRLTPEQIASQKVRPFTGGSLAGLQYNPDPQAATALRTTRLRRPHLTAYAYNRMQELADEFWRQRSAL